MKNRTDRSPRSSLGCNAEPSWSARWPRLAVLALVLSLIPSVVPARAEAYLDPGTGSMILQATLATLMGALLIVKTYWRRIKSVFSKKDAADSAPGETASAAESE